MGEEVVDLKNKVCGFDLMTGLCRPTSPQFSHARYVLQLRSYAIVGSFLIHHQDSTNITLRIMTGRNTGA